VLRVRKDEKNIAVSVRIKDNRWEKVSLRLRNKEEKRAVKKVSLDIEKITSLIKGRVSGLS
jgi:hypothetical protein